MLLEVSFEHGEKEERNTYKALEVHLNASEIQLGSY